MLQTSKLKLNKIELTDIADITVINPNWDTVDTEITNLKTDKADISYVNQKVADIVGSAPEALDTLEELARALGQNENFATTVSTEIGKKVDKVEGKGLSTNDYTTVEKTKLAGIATNANNYTHPSTHPASIINQDANNRFVTDTEKSTWNNKLCSDNPSATGTLSIDSDIKIFKDAPKYSTGGCDAVFRQQQGVINSELRVTDGNNATDYDTVGMVSRYSLNGGSTWNEILKATYGELSYKGNKIYHANDKPTSSDVGALALTGGTLTGDLKITKSLATMTINSNDSKDASLILDRGDTNASYKILDEVGGVFKVKCNYNNGSNVDYYDIFYMLHSSGDAWHKGNVTAPRFISNVSTGTAPLTVASTTVVTNLNADMLDGVHASSFLRSDLANSVDVRLSAGDGRGIRFWDNDSYKICMSIATNSTYGGRMTGDTTSDYNMYFKMSSGTNRGFVFKGTSGDVMGIDGSGELRIKGGVTVGDNKAKMQYNATTESLDFIFV